MANKGAVISDQQERFIQCLVKGMSQREAYLDAYPLSRKWKDSSVDVQACRLFKIPKVRQRFDSIMNRIREKALEKTLMTETEVLQEYAKIARFDARKMFDENGRPLAITELDDNTAACIVGLDVEEKASGLATVKKYKVADKKGALDSYAKTLGMFTEKTEVTGTIKIELTGDLKEWAE